jgi:hypothetical protein
MALASYGPGVLLWVQPERPGFPAGQVVQADSHLLIGYVQRLATRENVPDLDVRSWMVMLRNALKLANQPVTVTTLAQPDTTPRFDLHFGIDGNASSMLGQGWSAAEDGFTWSIDGHSTVTIPHFGDADYFVLDMDVIPYMAGEALPVQILRVEINGQEAHSFNPLARGRVACVVDGGIIRGRDSIEVRLVHPNAASPLAISGQDDARNLAVAFHRLSLIGHQALGANSR